MSTSSSAFNLYSARHVDTHKKWISYVLVGAVPKKKESEALHYEVMSIQVPGNSLRSFNVYRVATAYAYPVARDEHEKQLWARIAPPHPLTKSLQQNIVSGPNGDDDMPISEYTRLWDLDCKLPKPQAESKPSRLQTLQESTRRKF